MRRAFLWINFVLAAFITLAIFLQAYLITAYVSGAGEGALDAHGFIGFALIHLAELLVFLTAFGAWPKQWKWIGFTFFLFVLGTVQIFLAPPDEDPASGVGARPPRRPGSRRGRHVGRDRAPRHARSRAQAWARRRRCRTTSTPPVTASAIANARRSPFQGSSSNVLPPK